MYNRGLCRIGKGEWDKGISDFSSAIRLDGERSMYFSSRAVCQSAKGQGDKAIVDCDKAIQLDPANVLAFHLRATLRITCPVAKYRDGRLAIRDATRLCELTAWKEPGYLPTLAAAYAEVGEFGEAIKWQKRVVEAPGLNPAEKDAVLSVLKLYEQNKRQGW